SGKTLPSMIIAGSPLISGRSWQLFDLGSRPAREAAELYWRGRCLAGCTWQCALLPMPLGRTTASGSILQTVRSVLESSDQFSASDRSWSGIRHSAYRLHDPGNRVACRPSPFRMEIDWRNRNSMSLKLQGNEIVFHYRDISLSFV